MEPTQYTSNSVITAGTFAWAVVAVVQTGIELLTPETFWTVVQQKSQLWPALVVILTWALLRWGWRLFAYRTP